MGGLYLDLASFRVALPLADQKLLAEVGCGEFKFYEYF